ncbi:hypothetical protein JB92DRAFT_2926359 [Gautieria morchelliformis]|nr:hypothetical protein JB92DRAFT_2926359 [Gautieria morchelliformis]
MLLGWPVGLILFVQTDRHSSHRGYPSWEWQAIEQVIQQETEFVVFVLTLVFAIGLFDYLTFAYFSAILPSSPAVRIPGSPSTTTSADAVSSTPVVRDELSPEPSSSCLLPESFCAATSHDPFLFAVAAWATLQLSCALVLLAGQLWQIMRQMTTLEVSNLGRYGFLGGRGGTSLSSQQGHAHQHTHHQHTLDDDVSASSVGGEHTHKHAGGCTGFIMNILGLDRFTKGKATEGLARSSSATNPFDLGCMENCMDFWTTGKELGVEYETLYDVPLEGFRAARARGLREEERERIEDPRGYATRRKGKGLFMGMSLGRGSGGTRDGYQPVRMDDPV